MILKYRSLKLKGTYLHNTLQGMITVRYEISGTVYSRPSILRPPMGPRKCGLILQVVLK